MGYSTDFTQSQRELIISTIGDEMPVMRKYCIFDVLSAISYVIRTGCQWEMLPTCYPNWRSVYHHFRSWVDRGWFSRIQHVLVESKRESDRRSPEPTTAVVDSQSVRWGLRQSDKGIDGHKRVKGIKRHISVDSCGYVLAVYVTRANTHDSRAAYALTASTLARYDGVSVIKADMGYSGALQGVVREAFGAEVMSVKSNYGTSEFIPLQGRWVVERTFAWMEDYRRLNRNYERHLSVAAGMFMAACVIFMLRYFR